MSMKAVAFAGILFAAFSSAQTPAAPPIDKTFEFANKPSPQALQETATILRTVADIRNLSIDSAAYTLTVHGTADDLATTAWIVRALDQPPGAQAVPPEPYLIPGASDDQIRIFHLAHAKTPQNTQEFLTVLRTVGDVRKIFNYTPLSDLVIRADAATMALTEYFIANLDIEPGAVKTSTEFHYQSGPEVARVFYLQHVTGPRDIQEILSTLRIVADIQKIFNYTADPALAVRGSAADLATTDWLIQALDIPADSRPSVRVREFTMPGNYPTGGAIGVYYPANIAGKDLATTMTFLRTNLSIRKTFDKTAPPTLIFRGTADQVTKAEELIKEKDQPAHGEVRPARPAYEVASVKPDISGADGSSTQNSKGRIVFTNQTLERLIERAFEVRSFQVVGPGWLQNVRFDIVAKYPPGTKSQDDWPMLRTLLEDRFALVTHAESKEMQGYALVVAKGGFRLRPVAPDGNSGSTSEGGRIKTLTVKQTSLTSLAGMLAGALGQAVVDRTGIEGVYDFELRWTADDDLKSADPQAPSLFTALGDTLGLRLQPQKIPVPIVVVDHVARTPTEN